MSADRPLIVLPNFSHAALVFLKPRMYFQSLDPGLNQCPFATGRPPVSRILNAERGACSRKYRHDGSRCVF